MRENSPRLTELKSTLTPTSTSSSLSSSSSSSSSSATPSATANCTPYVGIYALEDANTGNVGKLTAQPGTSGAYLPFSAYTGGLASRFNLQADCSLVSFDGGLLAMARDQDTSPKVVWLFPSTTIAQAQLSGTWTPLTCSVVTLPSGNTLQASVSSTNIFQVDSGNGNILLIGSTLARQPITIRLVACSDGMCFQQPDP